jgi:hypothetical protein
VSAGIATVVGVARAIGGYLYEFIVGDDWKIAVSVVAALGLLVIIMLNGDLSDAILCVLGAALIMAFFSVAVVLDVHGSRKR